MEPAVVTWPALAAELRAVAWAPVAAAAAGAGLLLALDATVWPHGPGAVTAWLGIALLAGAACFVLDQPAEAVVRSAPTSRRWRTAVRSAAGLMAVAPWSAYAVLWRSQTDISPPRWWAMGLVGLALVILGLGVCSALARRGQVEPATAVVGGLVLAVLGLGIVPLPGQVQALDLSGTQGSTTAFWVVVLALGATGLVWGSRDEGSRLTGHTAGRHERR